ncbi:MAG: DUF1552 domain-containing protein, partial [Aureliella sp.]
MSLRDRRLQGLNRRYWLRAAGVCVGLPWLESLAPRAAAAASQAEAPRRLVYLYVPNGVNVAKWQVAGEGANYQLSPTLAPLAKFRSEITVITGL